MIHDSTKKYVLDYVSFWESFFEWDKLWKCNVIGRRMKGKIDSSMARGEFWSIYQTQFYFLFLIEKFVNKKTKLQE